MKKPMRSQQERWGFKHSPVRIKGKTPQQTGGVARSFYRQLDENRFTVGKHYLKAHAHRVRTLPDTHTAGSPDFDAHLIVAAKKFLGKLKGKTCCEFGAGYGTLLNALGKEGMKLRGIEKEKKQTTITKQFVNGQIVHGIDAGNRKQVRSATGNRKFNLTISSLLFQSNIMTEKAVSKIARNIAEATEEGGYSIHFAGTSGESKDIVPIKEFEKQGLELVEVRHVYGRGHDPMLQKMRKEEPALTRIIPGTVYIFQKKGRQ